MKNFIRRLRTVLVSGTGAIDEKTIPRLHKSFFEFITSERVEPHFRVNQECSNGELAIQCLNQLPDLLSSHAKISALPAKLRYAMRFWLLHLPLAEGAPGVAILDRKLKLRELQNLIQYSSNDNKSGPLYASFSSDRSQIITSMDNNLRSWDAGTGRRIEKIFQTGHTGALHAVAISPNGKLLASGSADHGIRLWDSENGQLIGSPFRGHSGNVWSVSFSPDGEKIASCGDRTIRLWEVSSGKAIGTPFQGHADTVWSIAFSPDGNQIASGSADQTIRLWDVSSGQPLGIPLRGHTAPIWSVAFSSDGRQLLSGSVDSTICLWDVQSRQVIGSPFTGHTAAVWSVAFSPSGNRVLSGSMDRTIRLWDPAIGQPIGSPFTGHTGAVVSVKFSPTDENQFISGSSDKTIRFWNTQTNQSVGAPLAGHADAVNCVVFSSDGKQIFSASDDKQIRVWDGTGVHELGATFTAFSPDGRFVLSASLDNKIRLWDSQDSEPVGLTLGGDVGKLSSIAFLPSSSHIIGASSDGDFYMWDIKSRLFITSSKFLAFPVESIRLAPNDRKAILAYINGTSWLWDNGSFERVDSSSPPVTPASDNENCLSLTVNHGWLPTSEGVECDTLRWFPLQGSSSTLWVYVKNHLICCQPERGSSITIVPVTLHGT